MNAVNTQAAATAVSAREMRMFLRVCDAWYGAQSDSARVEVTSHSVDIYLQSGGPVISMINCGSAGWVGDVEVAFTRVHSTGYLPEIEEVVQALVSAAPKRAKRRK